MMCSDCLCRTGTMPPPPCTESANGKRTALWQRDIVEETEMLVRTANENGGKDNITVVLIEPFSDEVKD